MPPPDQNTPRRLEVEGGGGGGGRGESNGDGTADGGKGRGGGIVSSSPTDTAAIVTASSDSGVREEGYGNGDIGPDDRRGSVGGGGGGGGGEAQQQAGRQPLRGAPERDEPGTVESKEDVVPGDDPPVPQQEKGAGLQIRSDVETSPAAAGRREGEAGSSGEEERPHPPEREGEANHGGTDAEMLRPAYVPPPPAFWESVEGRGTPTLSGGELGRVLEGVTEEEAERFLREQGMLDAKGNLKP